MVGTTTSNFQGCSVLVTGATSGIGAATAIAFGQAGAHVLVSGRDQTRGEATCEAVRSRGGNATLLLANLADHAAVVGLARLALEAADAQIDVLVNAAGAGFYKPSADVTIAYWDEVYAVNARAPFFLTSAIAPTMAKRGRGAVINIASAGTTGGVAGLSLFNSAKSALKAMSMNWAAEYGPYGVNVNAIDVAAIRTPINLGIRDMVEAIAAKTPAGGMVEPEQIADAILFLATNAARHIHGITMPVDGGYTITHAMPG
jgi:NAD(P)-dependent dehydrogenase (short-subunit alcohol dehydrogenase family)